MAKVKFEGKVNPNEVLGLDPIEVYGVAFSDSQSRVQTAIVGRIPTTGVLFFFPSLDDHFVDALPDWLTRRLETKLSKVSPVKRRRKNKSAVNIPDTKVIGVKQL